MRWFILLLLTSCALPRIDATSEYRYVRTTYETTECHRQAITLVTTPHQFGDGMTFLYQDDSRRIFIENLRKVHEYAFLYHGHDQDGVLYNIYIHSNGEIYLNYGCVNISVSKKPCIGNYK